ncbi:MAG: PKD domain-containing protein [Candidatus Thermoplasmatota archaeon]|nr:PKD domain-containing protein [Candidatus Thermoplasmatota archaeon]
MIRKNFETKKSSWLVSILICMFLITTTMAVVGQPVLRKSTDIYERDLNYTFLFEQPSFNLVQTADAESYTTLSMKGCLAIAEDVGDPLLPVKFVKLLLPPMKTVADISISGNLEEVDLVDHGVDLLEDPILPHQQSVPFGQKSSQSFVMNQQIYSFDDSFPSAIIQEQTISYSHGYTILDVTLNPTAYIPGQGKLFYYPEMTVDIALEDTQESNMFYRSTDADKAWVQNLVMNPNVIDTYDAGVPTFDYPGGLCDPEDHYDYVIITTTHNDLDYWDTTTQTPYNWDSLMDKHTNDDGLSCTLVTIQDIDACTDYHSSDPLFNDQQAHIREFCKDAYQDWGTSYILIGGDDEWIPARHMKTNYEGNIDSDLYWSNLDNTFNEDGDYYWGEEGDDGFDLYSELFIGRLTCDGKQDVSNWMTKSFYYADSVEEDYLDNAAFYGGDTTWQCQGDDFIDYSAIKGTDDWLGPYPHYDGPFPSWAGFQFGFETWNLNNAQNSFDLSVKWTAEPPNPGWQGGSESAAIAGLRNDINNDQVTLISGIAHANAGMSLDVGMGSWESQYTNTKPFFIHDYGCHCGDMDASSDGVLHSMLFHSDTELAFACVYNTCYGWGNLYCTNSSSAFQQKMFWHYFFDMANNSGDFTNWQLGKGQAWSKDMMAPTINWDYSYGTWRAIIQGCLLFGDPAQQLKTPHPSEAPSTPTAPTGPLEWVINQSATFSATATDPEEESIYYLFDWGDGSTSGWVGPYPSGETGSVSHEWKQLGDYNVRVKARDQWGAASDWSDVSVISIIENSPPALPTVTGPGVGFGEIEFTISTADPNDHDVLYYVSWDDGTNTGWFGPYTSGEEVTVSHVWQTSGKYTINVRSRDFIGDKSGWTKHTILIPIGGYVGVHSTILNSLMQQTVHTTQA